MKKSEILESGLQICELACSLRKRIAAQKKLLETCESDEEVIASSPDSWDEELNNIEDKMDKLADDIRDNTNWTFFSFWNHQMKCALDFNKEIHFFPNKVVKFVDWCRHAINNCPDGDE